MASRVVSVPFEDRSYEVRIGSGVLNELPTFLQNAKVSNKIVLVVDHALINTSGASLREKLEAAGFDIVLLPFDATEQNKSLASVGLIYDALLNHRVDRKGALIALGGGITGDTAGFAAATYLRGILFIQCPTTLLSMVDASIGGKTGVNVTQGKNLIGAIYQPSVVLSDTETLLTLPQRDFACGLGECVKHGLGREELFCFLENLSAAIMARQSATLPELVEANVRFKAEIVAQDERESGIRAVLNLGHTFAHAIETATHYGPIRHGEAVALGLIAALETSVALQKINPEIVRRTKSLLSNFSLPISASLPSVTELLDLMLVDKKTERGVLRLVLPEDGFKLAIVENPPTDAVVQGWRAIGAQL